MPIVSRIIGMVTKRICCHREAPSRALASITSAGCS